MKYLFFILFLFVSFSEVFSQNEEIDSLVINSKSVVAISNLNVLYRGIESPIRIAVSGVEKNQLFVCAKYGNVKKSLLENEYIYYPDSVKIATVREETILVFKISNIDTFLVGKHIFTLKNLPEPEIQLGSISKNGRTVINKVMGANAVFAIVPDCDLQNYMFDVKSFTIILIKSSGDTIIYKNNKGNVIDYEFCLVLRKVKTRDKVILKDVFMKNSPTGVISKSKDTLEVEVE